MKMQRKPAVMSLLVSTLLAAGCGGGDGGGSTTTVPAPEVTTTVPATTTAAPSTTAAAVTSSTAAAAAANLGPKALAAIFQQADLPAGWKPVDPADPQLNLETVWTELTKCLAVPATKPLGIATSPTYIRGLATQARSTVEYTTEAAATAFATALAAPKVQGCLTDAFNADVKRSAPEGGVPGPVAIASHNVGAVAPKTNAYRITAEISLSELKVPINQDFVVIFSGGTIIRALFLNPGSEFPQDLEKSLLQKVVSRA